MYFIAFFIFNMLIACESDGASSQPEVVLNKYEIIEEVVPAPEKYKDFVKEVSQEYRIDYKILCAVIEVESKWNEKAVNYNDGSYDYGLGQINSKYEAYYVKKFKFNNYDRENPYHNIKLSAMILAWSMKGLSLEQGVMAYNCGRSAVIHNRIPKLTKKYLGKVMDVYSSY